MNFCKSLFYFFLVLFLISCANPLKTIQPDIDLFLKKYPRNFGFVETDHRRVHYAWSGDPAKRPLVFVHGSPGSWQGWAKFLTNDNLQKNFYLIAVDRLGYGESGKGVTEPALERQAQAVLDALSKSRSQRKSILIGHSFGGPVIAKSAMMNSNQISGLVFVAGSVSADLEKMKWFQYPATWWPLKLLIPTDLRVCNEEIFSLKNELLKMSGEWSKIDLKIIVLQGTKDQLVPVGNADFLQNHLPKKSLLSLQKIPNQGHFIPWERPDLILKAIEDLDAELLREGN